MAPRPRRLHVDPPDYPALGRALAERTTAAQGLPLTVEDRSVLRSYLAIVAGARSGSRQRGGDVTFNPGPSVQFDPHSPGDAPGTSGGVEP